MWVSVFELFLVLFRKCFATVMLLLTLLFGVPNSYRLYSGKKLLAWKGIED